VAVALREGTRSAPLPLELAGPWNARLSAARAEIAWVLPQHATLLFGRQAATTPMQAFKRSLADALVEALPGVDVHLVRPEEAEQNL
jgi:hypothetical protein